LLVYLRREYVSLEEERAMKLGFVGGADNRDFIGIFSGRRHYEEK
jgi:hypothetical protein